MRPPIIIAALVSSSVHSQGIWRRDASSTDQAAPAMVSGISSPGYTSGTRAVVNQLKSDANKAVDAFATAVTTFEGDSKTQSTKETAQLFSTIVKGAMSYPINQNIGSSSTPSQDRLNAMANSINNTLNSINDMAEKILSSSNGALHYNDLKDCINGLVQQGGLQTGESCTMNGMSISGVSNIMTSVLENFGNNGIPTEVLAQATKALDPTFTAIIPGEKKFYDSVNNAITSVQASVSGQLVAALNDAQNCFEKSMKLNVGYEERVAFTQQCNRSPAGGSVYNDLKTLYLSVTNQMVGYLPPQIIDSIHTISEHYLDTSDTSSDAAYFRSAISNTTASIVASNSGNSVTYAYALADCLDSLVGTTDPHEASNIAKTKNCLSKPTGPPASVKMIVYGYIQQIHGVLPAQLAAKIESSGVKDLDPKDPQYDSKVDALHQQFMKTDPGPEYVTCYEAFVDCLFNSANGALENPGNTQSVCLLGDSCKSDPDGNPNLAVPLGRRSFTSHFNRINQRGFYGTSTRVQNIQKAHVVRKYKISTPPQSYLLKSFMRTYGTHK
uniref:Uncharacterized protein n=1 Tax=Phakopsora pachyrhizi TaxID=170000 RepID=A0A0S1MJD3_PHAPC